MELKSFLCADSLAQSNHKNLVSISYTPKSVADHDWTVVVE